MNTVTQAPADLKRNRLTILLIIGLFVAPIVLAWLYVAGVFDWRAQGLLNRGNLISPPIDITALNPPLRLPAWSEMAPSNWAVIVVTDGACAAACGEALDRLLIIRELLGQGSERVSIHALATTAAVPSHQARIIIDPATLAGLQKALAHATPPLKLPAIVFLDWRHQLMMHYVLDTDPKNIQQDLKRMLRASAIR